VLVVEGKHYLSCEKDLLQALDFYLVYALASLFHISQLCLPRSVAISSVPAVSMPCIRTSDAIIPLVNSAEVRRT
jgi:hypothetical protein